VRLPGDTVSGREHSAAYLFAEELRQLRQAKGISQDQLGTAINFSGSLVGMVESGRRAPTVDFAAACDELFGTTGTLTRLAEVLRDATFAMWFQPWAQREQSATKIRSWQGAVVDGLLQVRSYAAALLSVTLGTTDDVVEQQVAARMARQEVLSRPDPPVISVLLDEVVLRRPVGGRAVMREQIEHLISLSDSRNIVVQVVPLAAGSHAGLDGSFAIAEFRDAPSLGYAETALTGIVVEQREQVAVLENRLDGVRAEALPRVASLQFMKDVVKEWT
jgi:transcriptional regulator with XRE-family HTH domain